MMALRPVIFFITIVLCLSSLPETSAFTGQTATVIENAGGITLSGNESLVITDQDYKSNGSILISENASLKLVNTHLDFTEGKWKFELSGNGRLILENSDINMTQPGSIIAHDGSSITLTDSEVLMEFWCPIHLRYHYSYTIELLDESRLQASNSKIGYLLASTESECSVEDSFIGHFFNRLSTCRFANTTLDSISFYFSEGNYSCRLNLSNNVPHWSSQFEGGEMPGNLTLDNVTINLPPMILAANCTLQIRDSNLNYIKCFGHSDLSVDDSNILSLVLWGDISVAISRSSIRWIESSSDIVRSITVSDSRIDNATLTLVGDAIIEDSRIGQWDSGWLGWIGSTRRVAIRDTVFESLIINSHTEYSLRNVTISKKMWIQPDFHEIRATYIRGDFDYQGKTQSYDWYSSESIFYQVTREFEVKVERGREPIDSAILQLKDGNETIWNGVSDEKGYARFNVTFRKVVLANPIPGQTPLVDTDNMTKTLALLIEDGGDTKNMTLGLFSRTPLLVSFKGLTCYQTCLVAVSTMTLFIASVSFVLTRLLRRHSM